MSDVEKNGGSAFPVQGFTANASGSLDGVYIREEGMSLRDWFAGQALTGILASETTGDGLIPMSSETPTTCEQRAAIRAYEFADAMLAARAKQPTHT